MKEKSILRSFLCQEQMGIVKLYPYEYLKDRNCDWPSGASTTKCWVQWQPNSAGFGVCFLLAFDRHQIPSSQQFSVFHSLSKIILDLVFSKCWQPLSGIFTTESQGLLVVPVSRPQGGWGPGLAASSSYPPLWRFSWVQGLCTFCSLRNYLDLAFFSCLKKVTVTVDHFATRLGS